MFYNPRCNLLEIFENIYLIIASGLPVFFGPCFQNGGLNQSNLSFH